MKPHTKIVENLKPAQNVYYMEGVFSSPKIANNHKNEFCSNKKVERLPYICAKELKQIVLYKMVRFLFICFCVYADRINKSLPFHTFMPFE